MSGANEMRFSRFAQNMLGLCLVLSPFWVWALFNSSSYSIGTSIIIVPLEIVGALLLFRAFATDKALSHIAAPAVLWKIVACSAYMLLAFTFFTTDALGYFQQGAKLASIYDVTHRMYWIGDTTGTAFIQVLVAWFIVIFGPSLPAAAVTFSLLAVLGGFFFYRAFCIACPDGDTEFAAILIFFYPSVVFWTATIGKDALIHLGIGLVAYGFARLQYKLSAMTLISLAVGVFLVGVIRIHIVAMLGISAAGAYTLSQAKRRDLVGGLSKFFGLPLIVVLAVLLIGKAQHQLGAEDTRSTLKFAQQLSHATNQGGSVIGGQTSLAERIATAPFLMFRPFPWEVRKPEAMIASAEAIFLMVLLFRSRLAIWESLKQVRQNGFLVFTIFYGVIFSVAISGTFLNVGLMARQRVMLLPFVLMWLCLKPNLVVREKKDQAAVWDREWRQLRGNS